MFGLQPGLNTASNGFIQACKTACESSHFEASATRPQAGLNMALHDADDFVLKHSSRGPKGVHGACRGVLRQGARGE